jgi:hypothetical protein
MGQVYRARDTNLGRDIALKILPAAVAADIYVRRLEADGLRAGEATRVTTGGATQPRWSRHGRELYYVNVAKGYRDE